MIEGTTKDSLRGEPIYSVYSLEGDYSGLGFLEREYLLSIRESSFSILPIAIEFPLVDVFLTVEVAVPLAVLRPIGCQPVDLDVVSFPENLSF